MNQILSGWASLDSARKLIVALAAAATVICFVTILRLATSSDMALLYAGLEPATAGEVVASLEASGIAFEVRGGSIYVDSSVRDSTRLSLAAESVAAAPTAAAPAPL